MAASVEPRFGLNYAWTYGENGWNVGMDANMLRLGRFGVQLSAKTRATAAPPGSPVDGDTYIIPAGATGVWAGKTGQVAVWVAGTPVGDWVYAAPRLGWICFIENENKIAAFYGGVWSAGTAI